MLEGNRLPETEERDLAERLETVRAKIDSAARAAQRGADDITLLVVTKFHTTQLIRSLYSLGVRDIAENRHQEAQVKATELEGLDLNWHFVGQLQTKKARQAANYARTIHSLDREKLVNALAKSEHNLEVFLQVNLTDDPGRGGMAPGDVLPMAEKVLAAENLELLGLMGVAPLPEEEDARSAFERLAGYSESLQGLAPDAKALSAGMSHDYAEAIEFGATHLRIGSAITGKRSSNG